MSTGSSAAGLLARYGLRPKKSWGQNFLDDRRIAGRIVEGAALTADDVAVEIGAGLGALTGELAMRAARVIAIERDPDMVAVLRGELGDKTQVEITPADALEFDFRVAAARVGRPLVAVGNLPYQITTPLLFRVLGMADAGTTIARAVFMVQREVAERIVAGPGSKIYGRLSVMVQQAAEVKILFHVGPGAFRPPPSVTSTVFSLVPRAQPRAAVRDAQIFSALVRAAFGGRRKMLRRSLEPTFGGEAVTRGLEIAGEAGTRRGEELTVEELARLADALASIGARVVGSAAGDPDDSRDE